MITNWIKRETQRDRVPELPFAELSGYLLYGLDKITYESYSIEDLRWLTEAFTLQKVMHDKLGESKKEYPLEEMYQAAYLILTSIEYESTDRQLLYFRPEKFMSRNLVLYFANRVERMALQYRQDFFTDGIFWLMRGSLAESVDRSIREPLRAFHYRVLLKAPYGAIHVEMKDDKLGACYTLRDVIKTLFRKYDLDKMQYIVNQITTAYALIIMMMSLRGCTLYSSECWCNNHVNANFEKLIRQYL